MEELFFNFFEQYGDVTFLLLLCGQKGNGKTLRTERAMHVFPPNWTVVGGPSSEKSGMNGQSDSTNGKNVIYDEMLDALCYSEGSDRLEFWKQILLKREYTYQRTVPVKNPDGTESHRTMKLLTPHAETHVIATNYGMAFTKEGDPSDTKFAMIDRSVACMVRSIGTKAHTDEEFNQHMAKPDQQRKLAIFRIFVCLVGAVKLMVKGVPSFQPNFALANRLFDYLDNQVIVGEYNLPRRLPRKALKRESNMHTMTVMNAVAKVFLYKQTAVDFEAGSLGEDGLPRPFRWTMLYDVIRQLVPTPEIIFTAWSQSLEYNAGTASHSVAAMTAVCEMFSLKVGDWMRKPPSEDEDDVDMQPPSPTPTGQLSTEDEMEKNRSEQSMPSCNKDEILIPLVGAKGMQEGEVSTMVDYMARTRRVVSSYRHRCGLEGNSTIEMRNPVDAVTRIMEGAHLFGDVAQLGVSPDDTKYMPMHASCVLSSAVQVGLLYHQQATAAWMHDKHAVAATIGCKVLGTKGPYEFSSYQSSGAQVWNAAWLEKKSVLNWMCIAREIVNQNFTCKIFDLPQNGLRDLLFLLSTGDNKRRCTEEPRVPHFLSSRKAFLDLNGTPTHASEDKSISIDILMRGPVDTRDANRAEKPGFPYEKPRHPYSGIHESKLQRGLDFALNSMRLPAMSVHFSNNVTDSPPLRIIPGDGDKKSVQLNTAAALEHTKMIAEACLRCSIHPGMRNHQERFCGDAAGPDGLERSREAGEGAPPEDDAITKISYSIDIFGISITLDALSRYYDPNAAQHYEYMKSQFGDLDVDFSLESRVHTSLKYVGLKEEPDRRFLSTQLRPDRNAVFEVVDVHTPVRVSEYEEIHSMVSMMVGHHASDEEVHRFQCAREGSRAMSGVRGDLLSLETWLKHSATVLSQRGMVSGRNDAVLASIADEPYLLRARVAEAASIEINRLVDEHEDMVAAHGPAPGDERLSTDELAAERKKRCQNARMKLYREIDLGELDDLRHYGPLRITHKLKKRTYQNMKPSPARAAEEVVDMVVYSEADEFQTSDDLLCLNIGRKKTRTCDGDGLHLQGRKDVRMRH